MSYLFYPVSTKESGSNTTIYKYHCLPTTLILVDENTYEIQIVDGCEFLYKSWMVDDDSSVKPGIIKVTFYNVIVETNVMEIDEQLESSTVD